MVTGEILSDLRHIAHAQYMELFLRYLKVRVHKMDQIMFCLNSTFATCTFKRYLLRVVKNLHQFLMLVFRKFNKSYPV